MPQAKRRPTQLVRCTQDADGLDEVVIGDWLHLEAMSTTGRGPVHYWLRIGQRTFDVSIERRNGSVTMTEQE